MKSNKIQLLKIRDFGEVISTLFSFVRQNFKPLFKSALLIAGPFFLLGGLILGFIYDDMYNLDMLNNMDDPDAMLSNLEDPSRWIYYGTGYFFMIVFILLGTALVTAVTYTYMKMYRESENGLAGIEVKDVWDSTKKNLGNVIVTMLVMFIGFFLLALICIVPGIGITAAISEGAGVFIFVMLMFVLLFFIIYLAVPLWQVFIVRLEEKIGVIAAFKRCFELTKGKWWVTLLLVIVVNMIVSMISYGAQMPMFIWQMIEMFNEFNDGGIIMAIFGALGTVVSSLCYVIYYIAGGIVYYSNRERLEGTGLKSRIDTIGTNTNYIPDSEGSF